MDGWMDGLRFHLKLRICYAMVTTTIRLQFDHATTVRRHASRPICCAAALKPK